MSFKIISDTSCNLPLSILKESDVDLIPFFYYPKNESQHVMQSIDIDEFNGKAYYDSIRSGIMYDTFQISPQRYFDYVEKLFEKENEVLFISMSSGISGSYNSAMMAKGMLEESYPDKKFLVFDTMAASLGQGIPVLKAIEYRSQGLNIDECYAKLEEIRPCIYQIFTVENLRHLQRTGRLSNAAMIIGTVLQLKPILKGNTLGQIINIAKVRGTKNSIKALANKYNEIVKDPENQVVGIAHADNQKDADYLASLLNEKNPPKEILTVCYEPVTGSHVGPSTVALFFLGDKDARNK